MRLVDPDTVALHNLHRQTLYLERDVTSQRPKVELAAERLHEANGEVQIEAHAEAFDAESADRLLEGIGLALDASDNLEARFALNDACQRLGIPWIHGAIAGAQGLCLCVFPGGPCLRCLYPNPPSPSERPRLDEQGVLNAAASLVASLQVAQALAVLTQSPSVQRCLLSVDAWTWDCEKIELPRRASCSVCSKSAH